MLEPRDHDSYPIEGEFHLRLARLLARARQAIGHDQFLAASCLDRASRLLSGQAMAAPGVQSYQSGGLAGWQMHRIERFIVINLEQRIAASDLAAITKLGRGHFARAFKASYGQSPGSYIAEYRVDHAKRLMIETDMKLSEIAIACGMADQSHLCNRFGRETGSSPAVWRRLHRLNAHSAGSATRRAAKSKALNPPQHAND